MEFILAELHRNLPDEVLLADVVSVANRMSKTSVTMEEYSKHGTYHATTLTRRFGSWYKVLELCKLPPCRSPLNIPNEELFANIENLWRNLGRQPKYHEVKKPFSKYSAGTYEHRFGTWYNALRAFINDINGQIVESKKNNTKSGTINPRAINYRLRFLIMQRDNFRCRICGDSPASNSGITLHIDHIVPCAKGGQATFDNLQTLCSKCNLGKSDLDMY